MLRWRACSSSRFGCLNASETTSTTCAPFDEARARRAVAVKPSGNWLSATTTSRQGRQITHGNPRSPTNEPGFLNFRLGQTTIFGKHLIRGRTIFSLPVERLPAYECSAVMIREGAQ